MDLDLFGNSVEDKALTSTQRIVTRQAVLTGRDLYTTEPYDIERFIKAIRRDGVELPSPWVRREKNTYADGANPRTEVLWMKSVNLEMELFGGDFQ
jgi:hypothetical protein